MKNKQLILAISGVKNSGKTTLIENIIPILSSKGFKVATIKHDGHDFEPDVPNTDTYKHRQSGAYAVAIFSKNKYMLVKNEEVSEVELINQFCDADIILLEGFKNSNYPKIEVIRRGNSTTPVCKNNVLALVTDIDFKAEIPSYDLLEYESISNFIISLI